MTAQDHPRYNAMHQYARRRWPKSGVCEICKKKHQKTYWCNKDHKYRLNDTKDPIKTDWQELCYKCHRHYDTTVLGVKFGRRKSKIKIQYARKYGNLKVTLPVRTNKA